MTYALKLDEVLPVKRGLSLSMPSRATCLRHILRSQLNLWYKLAVTEPSMGPRKTYHAYGRYIERTCRALDAVRTEPTERLHAHLINATPGMRCLHAPRVAQICRDAHVPNCRSKDMRRDVTKTTHSKTQRFRRNVDFNRPSLPGASNARMESRSDSAAAALMFSRYCTKMNRLNGPILERYSPPPPQGRRNSKT